MLQLTNNPWIGLASYTLSDAHRFYGRQNEIRLIAHAIRQNLCTVIYGKSGTGKTSLIHAGVMPRIRSEQYVPVVIKLDHNDNHVPYDVQIIEAVTQSVIDSGGEVEAALSPAAQAAVPSQHRLWTFFHTNQFWSADNRRVTPVFFIDQFEEIFTLSEKPDEVTAFFSLIQELLQVVPSESLIEALHQAGERLPYHEHPAFRIILSLREDFLPRLEDHSYFIPELCQNRIGIAALNGLQALDVMLCPDPTLIGRDVALQILSKICHRPVTDQDSQLLALHVDTCILSLFCSELYVKAVDLRRSAIDTSMVLNLGDDIIQSFYERSVKGISPSALHYLEDHLLTSSGYRNTLAFEDTVPLYVSPKEIAQLEGQRIICRETVNGVERLEFTHDVLCTVAAQHRHSRKTRNHHLRCSIAWGQSIVSILCALAFLCTCPIGMSCLGFLTLLTVGNMLQIASVMRASRSLLSLGLQLAWIITVMYAITEMEEIYVIPTALTGLYGILISLFELSTPTAPRLSQFVRRLDNAPFRTFLRVLLVALFVSSTWYAIYDGEKLSRWIMYVIIVPVLLSLIVWLFALCRCESITTTWKSLFRPAGNYWLQASSLLTLLVIVPLLCVEAYNMRFGTVTLSLSTNTVRAKIFCQDGRYGLRLGQKLVLPPVYAEICTHPDEDYPDFMDCLVDTKLLESQPDYDVLQLSHFMAYHNEVTDSLAARMERCCAHDTFGQKYQQGSLTLDGTAKRDSISKDEVDRLLEECASAYYLPLAIYYAKSDSTRAVEYSMLAMQYGILAEYVRVHGKEMDWINTDSYQLIRLSMLTGYYYFDSSVYGAPNLANDEEMHNQVEQIFSDAAKTKLVLGCLPTSTESYANKFFHRSEGLALCVARIPAVNYVVKVSLIPMFHPISQTHFYNLIGEYEISQDIAEQFIATAEDTKEAQNDANLMASNLFSSLFLQQKFDKAMDIFDAYCHSCYYYDSDYHPYYTWPNAIASDLQNFAKYGMYPEFNPEMLSETYERLSEQSAIPGGGELMPENDFWSIFKVMRLNNDKLYWVNDCYEFVEGFPSFHSIKWVDYSYNTICCSSEQGYFLFCYNDPRQYNNSFYATSSDARVALNIPDSNDWDEVPVPLNPSSADTDTDAFTSDDPEALAAMQSIADCQKYLENYPCTAHQEEVQNLISLFREQETLQHTMQQLPTCTIDNNPEFNSWLNTKGRENSRSIKTDMRTPFSISEAMIREHPYLVLLVLDSKSLADPSEKQSWFDLYPFMDDDQIYKLYEILVRENEKMINIEIKYTTKQIDNIKKGFLS